MQRIPVWSQPKHSHEHGPGTTTIERPSSSTTHPSTTRPIFTRGDKAGQLDRGQSTARAYHARRFFTVGLCEFDGRRGLRHLWSVGFDGTGLAVWGTSDNTLRSWRG